MQDAHAKKSFLSEWRELRKKHECDDENNFTASDIKRGKIDTKTVFGEDAGKAVSLIKTMESQSSVAIVLRMLESMQEWMHGACGIVAKRIENKRHGGTLLSDLGVIATWIAERVKCLMFALSGENESERYGFLMPVFPLLMSSIHRSECCDLCWKLFVRFYTKDGAQMAAMHSIQMLDELPFNPIGERGVKDGVETDEKFRKYLNPSLWKTSYSAHARSVFTYRSEERGMWFDFDLKRHHSEAVSSAIMDAFTIQLLGLYSPQNEKGDIPSFDENVRVALSTVTNVLSDPHELFRDVCTKRIQERMDYLKSHLHGYKHDADYLGLESKPFDKTMFAATNTKSFFDAIEVDYDDNRDSEEDDVSDRDNDSDVQDDEDPESEKTDTQREIDELEKLYERFRETKHMKPLLNCAPSSIFVQYKMSDEPHAKDHFIRTLHDILELASKKSKRDESSRSVEDANTLFSKMHMGRDEDDDADDTETQSASSSSSSSSMQDD